MPTRYIFDTEEAIRHLSQFPTLALDIETTGVNVHIDRAAVVSLAGPDHVAAVLHYPRAEDKIPQSVVDLLNRKELITHNGTTFDMLMLHHQGVRPRRHYDTLIGELCLRTEGGWKVKNDLASVMKRRLGKSYKLDIDHETWKRPDLSNEQLAYAAGDVEWLHDMKGVQESETRRRGLNYALIKEQELTSAVIEMQMVGMPIDFEQFAAVRAGALAEGEAALANLRAEFGPTFNPNSSQQIQKALREHYGLRIPNARAETLGKHEHTHPAVGQILVAKRALRRSGMYSDQWLADYAPLGRVYPRAKQIGAETKRFAYSSPNMQQIPREWRRVFGGEPGKKVITADWDQLEVAIAAHVADDDDLRRALGSEDFHAFMAHSMGVLPEDTPPSTPEYSELRQRGKAGTFTYFFGGGANGIISAAAKWGGEITQSEAWGMIRGLNKRFPVSAAHIKRIRRRHDNPSPYIAKLPWGHERLMRVQSRSAAAMVNTPVQGTAAVVMKEALLELHRRRLTKYIGMVYHDEVVAVSVPEQEAEDFKQELQESMEIAAATVVDSVPITSSAKILDNWEY